MASDKNQKLAAKLRQELARWETEELRLFHAYNRHAPASTKLDILKQLEWVITRIETLKNLEKP